MNEAHVHLLLNHFPIIGSIIALLLALAGWVFGWKQVFYAGLGVMAGAAIFSIPVFLSGEGAEHMVEGLAGTNEFYLEEHEEIGKPAFYVNLIAGAIALIALLLHWRKAQVAKAVGIVGVVATLMAVGLNTYTGFLGGKIRHTEIVDGGSASTGGDHDHEDHD